MLPAPARTKRGAECADLRAVARRARRRQSDRCGRSEPRDACVLILAGASERFVAGGRVLVHRPYLEVAPAANLIESAWRQMSKDVHAYLLEMNVPEALSDLMMRTPPEQAHALTQDELDQFMLSGTDPVEEAEDTAFWAELLGVTSGQSRRGRSRRTPCLCGPERMRPLSWAGILSWFPRRALRGELRSLRGPGRCLPIRPRNEPAPDWLRKHKQRSILTGDEAQADSTTGGPAPCIGRRTQARPRGPLYPQCRARRHHGD